MKGIGFRGQILYVWVEGIRVFRSNLVCMEGIGFSSQILSSSSSPNLKVSNKGLNPSQAWIGELRVAPASFLNRG